MVVSTVRQRCRSAVLSSKGSLHARLEVKKTSGGKSNASWHLNRPNGNAAILGTESSDSSLRELPEKPPELAVEQAGPALPNVNGRVSEGYTMQGHARLDGLGQNPNIPAQFALVPSSYTGWG